MKRIIKTRDRNINGTREREHEKSGVLAALCNTHHEGKMHPCILASF